MHRSIKKLLQLVSAYAVVWLGHLAATIGVAVALTLIVLPTRHARGVLAQLYEVPRLWEMSTFAVALHFGIAACVWALAYIIFQLARLRFEERTPDAPRTVRLSRGTVVTETLVIMPVFLLLTFGMAQLTLNNIAGVLANVAAYQGARAAWVWQPEEDAEDRRMGLEDGTTEEKCRIAVAFAMMPVAPGDFIKAPMLNSDFADKSRLLAFGANIPLTGLVTDYIGSDLAELGAAGIGAGEYTGGAHYAWTLDTSSFAVRSVRKFTTAFLAASCDVQEDHSVEIEYRHHITMPMVGRIFGELSFLDGVGMVPGYYSTYKRSFGFQKQVHPPNRKLPLNELRDDPPLPEEVTSEDAVGDDFNSDVEDGSDTDG